MSFEGCFAIGRGGRRNRIPEDGGSFLGEDGELWERGGEERPEDEGWLGGEEGWEVDDGLDDWVDPVEECEEVEWRQADRGGRRGGVVGRSGGGGGGWLGREPEDQPRKTFHCYMFF